MLKKCYIFLLLVAAGFLLSTNAFAVPVALDFDQTGSGAFPGDTVYGFHASAVATTTVHQTLGADGILNDGDIFYESLSLNLLNGLDSTHSIDPLLYYGLSGITFNANLGGFITGYSSPTATTAANAAGAGGVTDDSFVSIFTTGNGAMLDGATVVMTYHLVDSAPAIFTPSVFNDQNVHSNISLAFEVDSINEDYFATLGLPYDITTLVGNHFLLAFAQGNIGVDSITGDEAADPDEILFGIDDNGFDIKFDMVPEPTTLLLLGFGLLGLAGMGRKKIA